MRSSPKGSLFKNIAFITVCLGEAISTLGGSFSTLASSWLVFNLTGSGSAIGHMLLIYFLPSLLVQLFIGPYLDRWNRKPVMICSQWARGTVSLFPLLLLLDETQIWSLYLVSLVNGLIQPLYVPSSMALIPTLVKKSDLTAANAYIDGTSRLMMVIGPPLGGLVVSAISGEVTLLIVAIAFFFSGSLLLVSKNSSTIAIASSRKEPWISQFMTGIRFFRTQPTLLWLCFFLTFVQFAVGVTSVINIPYIAQELHGDSLHYGLFIAGYPLGYFFGTLLVGRLQGTEQKLRLIMLGSLLIGGLTFISLAFIREIWLAILLETLAGIAAPFFHVPSNSLYQRIVPNELLGRVYSVRLLIIRTTMPLGILLGGHFAESWGTRPLFMLIGLLISTVSLFGLLLPFLQLIYKIKNYEDSTKV